MIMTEISNNIREELAELKKFTATPGNGVTRFPFTEEARMMENVSTFRK